MLVTPSASLAQDCNLTEMVEQLFPFIFPSPSGQLIIRLATEMTCVNEAFHSLLLLFI